jgi:hypothetical protein
MSYTTMSTCSCVAGITNRNGLDGPGFELWQGARDFSLLRNLPDRLWGPTSLIFNDYSGSFRGVKRPRREVYVLAPPSAEVKKG